MATLDERVKAAWDSGTPHALDREAEALARSGVAESEIYDALERLLLSVRAAGADEDTEEQINGVMDRLTGWCHASQRIQTARIDLPTEEEIAKLPRWARVAFAARCARRVLPGFTRRWPVAPADYVTMLEWAVAIGETSAAHAGRGDIWATPAGAITCAAYVCDAVIKAGLDRAQAVEVIKATSRAVEKFKDWPEEVIDPLFAPVPGVVVRNASVALANAIATSADAYPAAQQVAEIVIRRDFDHLTRLAERGHWTDDTPVAPAVFGPLWPEGTPQGWPTSPTAIQGPTDPPAWPADPAVFREVSNRVLQGAA